MIYFLPFGFFSISTDFIWTEPHVFNKLISFIISYYKQPHLIVMNFEPYTVLMC